MGGENSSSATVEVLRTFGYDTQTVDPRFDKCYFTGVVYDLKGKVITLDDGTLLEYFPWEESGYTTVFSIPEKIRLMNPNLTQNPGY